MSAVGRPQAFRRKFQAKDSAGVCRCGSCSPVTRGGGEPMVTRPQKQRERGCAQVVIRPKRCFRVTSATDLAGQINSPGNWLEMIRPNAGRVRADVLQFLVGSVAPNEPDVHEPMTKPLIPAHDYRGVLPVLAAGPFPTPSDRVNVDRFGYPVKLGVHYWRTFVSFVQQFERPTLVTAAVSELVGFGRATRFLAFGAGTAELFIVHLAEMVGVVSARASLCFAAGSCCLRQSIASFRLRCLLHFSERVISPKSPTLACEVRPSGLCGLVWRVLLLSALVSRSRRGQPSRLARPIALSRLGNHSGDFRTGSGSGSKPFADGARELHSVCSGLVPSMSQTKHSKPPPSGAGACRGTA
ncbi:hypothetical protein SAMN04487916_11754 [Arthrobacter sp. ov407]|nr:hypothetical protein SAMN04487916_11754 [Arthrobacter sp. ov407]